MVLHAGPAYRLAAADGLPGPGADARELDMRASPYDLSGYGFAPIRVEEPAGRPEYVRRQQRIAERAAPLRDALADRCAQLTAAVSDRTDVTDGYSGSTASREEQ